jgi:hypothetical protein
MGMIKNGLSAADITRGKPYVWSRGDYSEADTEGAKWDKELEDPMMAFV